jgi:hypothetical protein
MKPYCKRNTETLSDAATVEAYRMTINFKGKKGELPNLTKHIIAGKDVGRSLGSPFRGEGAMFVPKFSKNPL